MTHAADLHEHDSSRAPRPYRWDDPKRYLWLLGLIPATGVIQSMGLFALASHAHLGALSVASWFLLPALVFVFIPVLDMMMGRDGYNPGEDIIERLEADRYYRWCTYLYIPLQYACLILSCCLWTAHDLSWLGHAGGLDIISKIGIAWSVGITSGIGINTAHELGHKIDNSERWLSRITLATSGYGHFFIEHNRGHHARVATPEDPASARYGESFWTFLPRSVTGSLRSAWRLERERLARLDRSPWTIRNDVLSAWLMTLVLFAALTLVFGIPVLPWLVLQAVYGFCLLESVNYLEHYGLLRRKMDSGRYQRCRAEHSWNSDHLVTNIFLYHLQRHSDHHANPMKRYQVLLTVDDAPQLPAGYATMILAAYATPLWRHIMDPKVAAHYDGDLSRANLTPRLRRKIEVSPVETIADVDAVITEASAYACPHCGYTYTVALGAPREGFPPGTPWASIPDHWSCPDCSVRDKRDFRAVTGEDTSREVLDNAQ